MHIGYLEDLPLPSSTGGAFGSAARAEEWMEKHELSGLFTGYPVNAGSYDWAGPGIGQL